MSVSLFTLVPTHRRQVQQREAARRRVLARAETIPPPLLLFGGCPEPPFWTTDGIVSPDHEQFLVFLWRRASAMPTPFRHHNRERRSADG
ncbi:hypothetical protein [Roseiflexus sp.]|uniref:hypothetical protein n=1 Tax=Roseiflexus sp. TaxID=2562120 RepID=UPI00258BE5E9|nr:hypothetical protein [Roseiflexus sp.]